MSVKILIVSDCPSDPPVAGNRNCIRRNLDFLRQHGYDIYFLLVDNRDLSLLDIRRMEEVWGNKLTVFRITKFQHILQKIIIKSSVICKRDYISLDVFCPWFIKKIVTRIVKMHGIDSVVVNYIWLSSILDKIDVKCKAIYTHDVFSYRNKKMHSMWFSFDSKTEARALNRANHILAIQENEAIFFTYLAPTIDVIPIYIPFTYTQLPKSDHLYNLLFFSSCNRYNINGLKKFIDEIYPSIKSNFPQVKLLIGGNICNKIFNKIHDTSIELKGVYDKPEDFYSLGNIVINPVFEGTGLKVKTFEAISYGRFVLAHKHSKEGIFERSSAPIFECNTKEDYIKYLRLSLNIDLNTHSKLCKDYIERLNDYILEKYKAILK